MIHNCVWGGINIKSVLRIRKLCAMIFAYSHFRASLSSALHPDGVTKFKTNINQII